MITLIIAIVFLAILVLGHEFGHLLLAKFFRLRVDEFGFGFPPKILGKKIGETEYSLNLIPFGGFVKIHGENESQENCKDQERSFHYLHPLKKIAVLAAGVMMNFIIGWLAFSTVVFAIGVPYKVYIAEVAKGSPADVAGMHSGDELIDFRQGGEFINFIDKNKNYETNINVLRNGEKLSFQTIPRENPPAGEGRLGLKLSEDFNNKYNLLVALSEGGKMVYRVSTLILSALLNLFQGLVTGQWVVLNGVTGPVGIFSILGAVREQGALYLLQLLGLISLNLAVINLLPIPAVDGGRIIFVAFRQIFGKKLTFKFETAVHNIGLIFLLILMVVITIRDILRWL